MSNILGTEISGFLGALSFGSLNILIDYRDGLIALELKP